MKRSLFALALASAFACSAQAGELSYNYLEAGANRVSTSGTHFNGWGLRGSINIASTDFYGFGSYRNYERNIAGTGFEFDHGDVGIGYHYGLNDSTHLLGELAYVRAKAKIDGFGSDTADGYRASVGLRSAFSEHFEGLVKANYTDLEQSSGDFTGTVGLQAKFNATWGVTAEAEFGNGDKTYLLGLRASF